MRKKAPKKPLGAIRFKGNPWPRGHALVAFAWLGHVNDEGAWFDLHLESEDYSANDPPAQDGDLDEDEARSDDGWSDERLLEQLSPLHDVLDELGRREGLSRRNREKQAAFVKLSGRTFSVDPAKSFDDEDAAFHVYLLGHDSVAGHEIRFERVRGDDYAIDWKGRIALTYAGDDAFKHRFEATIRRARFTGFVLPIGTDKATAKALAERFLAESDDFELTKRDGRLWLVPSA